VGASKKAVTCFSGKSRKPNLVSRVAKPWDGKKRPVRYAAWGEMCTKAIRSTLVHFNECCSKGGKERQRANVDRAREAR